jgi:1-deoxy-D-xylulose-5-phosphate synthase
MRHFPGIVLMAPSDARELELMFRFAMTLDVPCAIRYPRAAVPDTDVGSGCPVELGKSVELSGGDAGTILAYGSMVLPALEARKVLADEGVELRVIDARFAKPLDAGTVLRELERSPFVLTAEEGSLAGGFGSAVLELASLRCADVRKVHLAGIPDRFVEHGPRSELLGRIALDARGLAEAARKLHHNSRRTSRP